jgi:hypothetical protein
VKDNQKQMRVRSEIVHKIICEAKDREAEGVRAEVKRLQEEGMLKTFECTRVQMQLGDAQKEANEYRGQALDIEKVLKTLKTSSKTSKYLSLAKCIHKLSLSRLQTSFIRIFAIGYERKLTHQKSKLRAIL